MVNINLDGEIPSQFEKVKLEEDSYVGEIKSVKLIQAPAFKPPHDLKPRVLFMVDIDSKELPLFCTPSVSKGSGEFNNSKLYDIFEKSNLLDQFAQAVDNITTDESLVKFCEILIGKKAKFIVSNSKKGTPNEYSACKSVLKFLSDDEAEKPEVEKSEPK